MSQICNPHICYFWLSLLFRWFKYDASDVPQQIIDLDDTFYDSKTGNLYLINTNP